MARDARLQIVIDAQDHASGDFRKLSATVAAETRKMEGSMKGLSREAIAARATLNDLGRQALQTGALLGAATLAGMAAMVRSSANYAEELLTVSQRTGIAVNEINSLRFAAEQSNVTFDALGMGIIRLQRAAVEAGQGNKTYAAAFARLGVSVRDANGEFKTGDVLFTEVADAINRVGSETEKTQLSMTLFSRSGAQLKPLFLEGAAGIRELQERARQLGSDMGDAAKSGDAFNDSMEEVKFAAKNLALSVSETLFPALTKGQSGFATLVGGVANFNREHPLAVKGLALLTAGLSGMAITAFNVYMGLQLFNSAVTAGRTIVDLLKVATGANTAALEAETVALNANTIAQDANATAAYRAAQARGTGSAAKAGASTAGRVVGGVGGAVGGVAVGTAAYHYGQGRGVGGQMLSGAGGVLGGAAAGAVGGSIAGPAGAVVGAGVGAVAGGWASTGRMAYDWGSEVVRGRRVRRSQAEYMTMLRGMTPEQRRVYITNVTVQGAGVGAVAGGWASTGRMAYDWGSEVVRGRRVRRSQAEYMTMLRGMTPEQRRVYITNVTVQGSVISERELRDTIHRETGRVVERALR